MTDMKIVKSMDGFYRIRKPHQTDEGTDIYWAGCNCWTYKFDANAVKFRFLFMAKRHYNRLARGDVVVYPPDP